MLAGIDVVIDDSYNMDNTYTNDMFVAKLNFSSAETAAVYPFLNTKVLRYDGLMHKYDDYNWGNAWFEDAIVRADVTVDDLASFFHPTLMPSTYKPRFFRNIAAGGTVTLATAAECDDPYATCPGETAPPKPPMELNYCSGALCHVAAPCSQEEDVCSKANEGSSCGCANSGKTCQCTRRGAARNLLFASGPAPHVCICAA